MVYKLELQYRKSIGDELSGQKPNRIIEIYYRQKHKERSQI